MVNPKATGFVGIAVNTDAGQDREFGIRPPGGIGFSTGCIRREGMTGFVCGLDENLEFEMFVGFPGVVYIYVMGYTGGNVHFFHSAIELHPTNSMVWTEIDTSPWAPGAQACLWSCGSKTSAAGGWKMRVKGSADDWWNSGWHTHPVLGVDAEGKVEEMVSVNGLRWSATTLLGYVDSYFEKHTNAKDVTPGAPGAWLPMSVKDKVAKPQWVSLQEWESSGANLYGMRKSGTFFDEKQHTAGGDWMLVHADPNQDVDFWLPLAGRKFYLHGEFHPTIV